MDNDPGVPGFGVQAILLAEKGVAKSRGYQSDGEKTTQVHTGKCSNQAAQDQAARKGTNAPVNEFPLEAAVNKGLLEPLINCILSGHYTPKKALMTTDTSTRNRQEPPQDISSLLMS